ncbi:MAG: nucleotidyl transferase AbiEii/AbiGii toxin family protein [Deltaproteobacteria bacterium]|nr:nucleotidyl transferase AbiEii/AbiGii toxin family protein [Deltaproteobacteria bacterium]
MLYKAIPTSVAGLLEDIHLLPLPDETYMAGGTAAAIYLNHRISVDIDLFTQKEFYTISIVSGISQKHTIRITGASEKDTLTAFVDDVKFSIFRYPYPLLQPLIYNSDFKIHLASPADIAAMKVVAIAQRGTAKDFIDLRTLAHAYGFSLDYLLSMVHEKYRMSDEYGYQVKKSLVYFDDALKSLKDVTLIKDGEGSQIDSKEWSKVEEFFRRFVMP